MKDKNQDIGWLILLFIASCFFGFLVTLLFHFDDTMTYLITSSLCTLLALIVLVPCYQLYQKRQHKEALRASITRGNYLEVLQSIDSDGKEMKMYWEWKLLAYFHSGNMPAFKKHYQNYMNEINECTTLERYILSTLHELLTVCESNKKPVNFMKESEHDKSPYTKRVEYQLYRNIRLGLMEYYKPQKNLVKIYFDKFIQQSDTISKPLLFYLYYLMTYTMMLTSHPQVEAYYLKTQSFIFDEESLHLCNEVLRPYMNTLKKGNRYENDMNREYENNRRAAAQQNANDGTSRTFNYQQPSFQRSTAQEEEFAPRRRASQYQNEFDALNATMQSGDAFQLYEENEFDQFPKRTRTEAAFKEPILKEDIDADLDPTWFVRKSLQEEPKETVNPYARTASDMQEPPRPQMQRQRSNPMQQNPYMNNNTYQDLPPQASYLDMEEAQVPHTHMSSEQPAFINQRKYQEEQLQQPSTPRTAMQQNPMAQPTQQEFLQNPAQRSSRTPSVSPQQRMQRQMPSDIPFQQPISPMQAPLQQTAPTQPQNPHLAQRAGAEPINEEARFDRFQTRENVSPRTPINESQAKVKVSLDTPAQKQHRFSRKKNTVDDPFAFDQVPPQANRQTINPTKAEPTRSPYPSKAAEAPRKANNSYKQFVKSNLLIFLFLLLDAVIISIASSSAIYNAFISKYPLSSDIIMDIIGVDAIVAVLMAYLTAGIHTGYTILKNSLKKWNIIAKVLLSPLLLIVFVLIGAICEIPYLIYAGIKSSSEGK